jgi:hypothetical protein
VSFNGSSIISIEVLTFKCACSGMLPAKPSSCDNLCFVRRRSSCALFERGECSQSFFHNLPCCIKCIVIFASFYCSGLLGSFDMLIDVLLDNKKNVGGVQNIIK